MSDSTENSACNGFTVAIYDVTIDDNGNRSIVIDEHGTTTMDIFSEATEPYNTNAYVDSQNDMAVAVTVCHTGVEERITGSLENNDLEQNLKILQNKCNHLSAENEALKELLAARSHKLQAVRLNHEIISNENVLISKEMLDIQRRRTEKTMQLRSDFAKNVNKGNNLYLRINTMRNGVRHLVEMVAKLILKINSMADVPTSSSSKTSNVAVGLQPTWKPTTASRTQTYQPGKNVIQLALERLANTARLTLGGEPQLPLPGGTSKTVKGSKAQRNPTSNCSRSANTSTSKKNKSNFYSIPPSVPQAKDAVVRNPSKTKYSRKYKTKKHHAVDVSRQHEGFYCVCGTSTTSNLGLTTHIKYYTYTGQFQCTVEECGKRYFTTSTLRQHMKAKHDLEYKGREGCRKCGQTFSSRMQLYLHCQSIHECGPLVALLRRQTRQKRITFTVESR